MQVCCFREDPQPDVTLRFNQTGTHLVASSGSCFVVFRVHPFSVAGFADFGERIDYVELLFASNIVAVVRLASVTLMDLASTQKLTTVQFSLKDDGPVLNVKMHNDKVIMVLATSTRICDHSCQPICTYETVHNPFGLVAVSTTSTPHLVVASPGIQQGHVRLQFIRDSEDASLALRSEAKPDEGRQEISSPVFRQPPGRGTPGEVRSLHRYVLTKDDLPVHDSKLSCLALSRSGTLLCTASRRGTLIRLFDTRTRRLLKELRRGTRGANLRSISVSRSSGFLSCSSDSGTVHLFRLGDVGKKVAVPSEDFVRGEGSDAAPLKRTGEKGFVSEVIDYVCSERSFGRHYLEPKGQNRVSFGLNDKLVNVIHENGRLMALTFDLEEGGAARRTIAYDIVSIVDRKIQAATGKKKKKPLADADAV